VHHRCVLPRVTVATHDPHSNSSDPGFQLGEQVGIVFPMSLSADDLIARFVSMEWQVRKAAALSNAALDSASLKESLDRGAAWPQRMPPPPRESLPARLQAARDAHLDGQMVLVVDGRQHARPDEMIRLNPSSKIAFLRLALVTRS